jgi:hypothetical protein
MRRPSSSRVTPGKGSKTRRLARGFSISAEGAGCVNFWPGQIGRFGVVEPARRSRRLDLARLSNPHWLGLDDSALCRLREALLILGLVQQLRPHARGRHVRRQLAQPSGLIGIGPHQFLMH